MIDNIVLAMMGGDPKTGPGKKKIPAATPPIDVPANLTTPTVNTSDASGRNMMYVIDGLHLALGGGTSPTKDNNMYSIAKSVYGEQASKSLVDKVNIFNQRPDVKSLSPEQRINKFYDLYGNDPLVQKFKAVGYSPTSTYLSSPDLNIQAQIAKN